MDALFPYAHVIAGILVLIVGFLFHWVGQLISVLNWEFATRVGLQEKELPKEYKVYEHAIAVADVAIGWVYGIAGIGLILGAAWGYQLAWIPGAILTYHGISAWVWEGNRRAQGHFLFSDPLRIGWCAANIGTGLFLLVVAWFAYLSKILLPGFSV